MSEEKSQGEKTVEELIIAMREKLLGLRVVPFASVNMTGKAIEWLLLDLERSVRALALCGALCGTATAAPKGGAESEVRNV